MKMEPIEKFMLGLCFVVVGICLVCAAFQPYFEARTFNKFSKTKATYFDALVSELRVMPDSK